MKRQLEGTKRSKRDDHTQIQTQTASVGKRPETPHRVNEATNIQTTVSDNQQQFMYIHSKGVYLQQEVQQTNSCYLLDWSDSLHSYGLLFLVVDCTTSFIHAPHTHTLVLLLIVSLCSCYVLFNKFLVKSHARSPCIRHSHQLSCDT